MSNVEPRGLEQGCGDSEGGSRSERDDESAQEEAGRQRMPNSADVRSVDVSTEQVVQ